MPKKSIWESNFWKTVIAISVIFTIIASFLTILQLLGTVDVYNLLLLPIINFFTIPIPLYSVPLAFLIVLVILLILAYTSSGSATISNPFYRAEVLDKECARYIALLCRIPRTTDFLKKNYQEVLNRYGGYVFEDCLKILEERGLVIFQNGKWEVTQKALDYIAKYHGN
jgi:cell division protein FtsW (lipid II flippase)